MPTPEFTIDDMLRLDAENSRLKVRVAELEQRLTDDQVVEFAAKVAEATKVWCADRYTMGPFGGMKDIFDSQNFYADLREFRRFHK